MSRRKNGYAPIALLLVLVLAGATGCGLGGDSGDDGGSGAAKTVPGKATAGPFQNGTVNAFKLLTTGTTRGQKGTALGSGETNTSGTFTLTITDRSWTGPVLLEVSGSFLDESKTASQDSGLSTIPATMPIRAILPGLSATTSPRIFITPVTELATRYALRQLSADATTPATDLIGRAYQAAAAAVLPGVAGEQLLYTDPLDAGVTPSGSVTHTDDQVQYGVVLAGWAQLAGSSNVEFAELLDSLGADFAFDGLLNDTADAGQNLDLTSRTGTSVVTYTQTFITSTLSGALNTFLTSGRNVAGPSATDPRVLALTQDLLANVAPTAAVVPLTFDLTVGSQIRISGAASTTIRTHVTLVYAWTVTREGTPVAVTGSTSAVVSFVPQAEGLHSISLTVSDGRQTGTASISLNVVAGATHDLSVLSFVVAPGTVTSGNTFTATLVVSNPGSTTVTSVTPTLSFTRSASDASSDFSGGGFQPQFADIPAGSSQTFVATVTAQPTAAAGTLSVGASVAGGGRIVNASPATLLLEAPVTTTTLSVGSFTLSTASGLPGAGFDAVLVVNNTGTLTATGVAPAIVFSPTSAAVAAGTPSPASGSLPVAGAITFTIPVNVGLAAPVGPITVTAAAAGSNASSVQAPARTYTVLPMPSATLVAEALSLTATQAGAGGSLHALVTVRNSSTTATALGVVPQLVFRRSGVLASGDFSLGQPAPASASLAPSARVTFDVPVTISTAAAAGTVVVSGTVQGSNSAAVTLPQANLTILAKASLSLTALAVPRSRVSTGQSFTVTATVSNGGALPGRVTQLAVGLTAGLTGGTFSGSTELAAGGIGTFPVTITATSANTYNFTTATFSAIDVTSGLALPLAGNSATSKQVVVQNRPSLAFGSVAPATALTGTTVRMSYPVTNNGPGNVSFINPALTFTGTGVTGVLFGAAPSGVVTGSTAQLPFDLTIGGTAAAGTRQVSLALDALTADTAFRFAVSQPLIASLAIVQNPAVSGISPASATTETARTLTAIVTVSNPNTVASTSVTVSLTGSGFTAVGSQANPLTIAASNSAQFTFTITAGGSAGIYAANFRIAGKFDGAGFVVQRTFASYLTLTVPATTVALDSLELYSTTVSRGQTIRVTVPVVNTLPTTATVVSFTVSDADFPTVPMTFSPAGGNPTSVAPNGGTTKFVFLSTVPANADLGSHLLRAGLRWRRSTDAGTVPATLVTRDATVSVQDPPSLSRSLPALAGRTGTADGAFLEKGTSGTVQFSVSNAAGTATARLTTYTASVTGVTGVRMVPPASVADLAAGDTRSIQFTLTATSGISTGSAAFNLTAVFRDLNRPLADSSGNITLTTQVAFQVVGAPRLSAKGTFPTTITAGERNVPLTVVYTNQTFSAPAQVNGVTLTFFKYQSATPNLSSSYQVKSGSPALPFTVPLTGTHAVTVTYLVDLLSKTTQVTTRTDMYLLLTGSDPATGIATGIEDGKLLDFRVDAARPRLVIDKLTPVKAVLSAGMTTRIDMQVRNTGGEDALLRLPSGPTPTFTADGTPVTGVVWSRVQPATGTIAANSTVTYSFNVTPTTTVSAFGPISLGGAVPATSAAAPNADVSTSATNAGTLTVARPANLASEFGVSLQAHGAIDKTSLASGQSTTSSTSVVVTVSARNSDLATAELSNFQLKLTSGAVDVTGQYAITLPSSTLRLATTEPMKLVTFVVTALQNAQKFRSIKVTAVMTASDVNSAQSTSVTSSDYWYVRDRATRVLGQANFEARNAGTTVSTLDTPECFLVDGSRLLISDTGNNRVLIYNTANDLTPTVVLGQADFNGGQANQGLSGAALDRMSSPRGLAVTGTKLLVADADNNRVLIFDNYTTAVSGDFADRQVGQFDAADVDPNRGAGTGNTVSNGFSAPSAVAVTGNYLAVSDTLNNRVVVYSNLSGLNSPIAARNAVATGVFGQSGITSTANGYPNQDSQGGAPPTSRTLYWPTGLTFWKNKLVVADTMNHRVLVYSNFSTRCSTTTTDQAADTVVGQPSFITATSPIPSASTSLAMPRGVWVAGDKLYVADSGNNRVLLFSGFGSLVTTGAAASELFGQELFDQSQINRRATSRTGNTTITSQVGGSPDGYSLSEPVGIFAPAPQGKTGFWTVDEQNNRVLLVPLP